VVVYHPLVFRRAATVLHTAVADLTWQLQLQQQQQQQQQSCAPAVAFQPVGLHVPAAAHNALIFKRR
jgi:hypothetical protein